MRGHAILCLQFLIMLAIGVGPIRVASASEEELAGPGVSVADIKKLDCLELQRLEPIYRKQLSLLAELRKRTHATKKYDMEAIEHLGQSMESDALEITKEILKATKFTKELGHVQEALESVLKLEAATEAAEKSTVIKRLLKASPLKKVLAIATKPSLVLGLFAIEIGLEVGETIADAYNLKKNGHKWFSRIVSLRDRVTDRYRGDLNYLAAIAASQASKYCPTFSLRKCLGETCADSVRAEESILVSDSPWWSRYKTVCDYWDKDDVFGKRLKNACADEVATLLRDSNPYHDLKGYPTFKATNQFVRDHSSQILKKCATEICDRCAWETVPIWDRLGNKITFKERLRDWHLRNGYCSFRVYRALHPSSPSASPKLLTGLPSELWDPRRHEEEKWRWYKWHQRQKELDKLERTGTGWAKKKTKDYSEPTPLPKPPPVLPKGVKLSCECIATCKGEEAVYPSYLYSNKPGAVKYCKEPSSVTKVETESMSKICAAKERKTTWACDWRRSDEPLERDQKCEWPELWAKSDNPVVLQNDSVVFVNFNSVLNYPSGEQLLRLIRIMAACKRASIKASFCFEVGGGHVGEIAKEGGGYRVTCWTTGGKIERRAMAYAHDKLLRGKIFSSPTETWSRDDKGKNDPLRSIVSETRKAPVPRPKLGVEEPNR